MRMYIYIEFSLPHQGACTPTRRKTSTPISPSSVSRLPYVFGGDHHRCRIGAPLIPDERSGDLRLRSRIPLVSPSFQIDAPFSPFVDCGAVAVNPSQNANGSAGCGSRGDDVEKASNASMATGGGAGCAGCVGPVLIKVLIANGSWLPCGGAGGGCVWNLSAADAAKRSGCCCSCCCCWGGGNVGAGCDGPAEAANGSCRKPDGGG